MAKTQHEIVREEEYAAFVKMRQQRDDLLAILQEARTMIAAIAVGRPNVTHSAAVTLGHKIAAVLAKVQQS